MKAIALCPFCLSILLAAPPPDPCQFLSDADVKEYMPGAKPGRLDRSKEKYGILACTWDGAGAHVGLSFSPQPTNETVEQEARGFVDGFVDPFKSDARQSVRVEKLSIPGGQAAAVVEPVDRAKGIITNMTFVTVRGKQYQATIFSSVGGSQDRAAKLKALTNLARAAAARM